jgi:hypothetical protein
VDERKLKRRKRIVILLLRMKEYSRGGKAYSTICVEDERILKMGKSIGILVLRNKNYSKGRKVKEYLF